jgi:hypothetical protein
MQINKDKVVEAARALSNGRKAAILLLKAEEKTLLPTKEEIDKLWDNLEEALNPPPPRLSKKICIDYLERFSSKEDSGNAVRLDDTVQRVFSVAIDYLKEPSLQWVKNTGVVPELKTMLVLLKNGKFAVGERGEFSFEYQNAYDVDYFVEKYIILE